MSYLGFVIPAILLTAHWIALLAGASIMFTAVAASYRDNDLTMKVHVVSANIGVALSQVYVLTQNWWMVLFFVVPSLLLLLFKVKTRVYWIEVLAFITLALTIR